VIRLCSALLCLLLALPAHADWQFSTVEGADGVPLNMVTAGDPAKPAILLIHGIGQSHYSFVHQLNSELAEDFYLVTFDLRGHGVSGKPWEPEAYSEPEKWAGDVDAIMTAAGLEQPVVLGWSYGTLVLMDYLRVYGSDKLGAIVLTGALGGVTPFRMPPADDPDAMRFAEVRKLQMSDDFDERRQAAEVMVDMLTAGPIPEPYREIFMNAGFMMPLYARGPMITRKLDNQDLQAKLDKLPTLLMIGLEDSPTTVEDAPMLAERYDNVSYIGYEGVGHSAFFEQPERFNADLREFVTRGRSAAAPAAPTGLTAP
jgi:pimeloyl-ACP methyl ester carboxylesterase